MTDKNSYIKINKWFIPFSWLYGVGVKIRNILFDTGMLRSRSYAIPVISVGNITVGGTGKTPHVEYLIELLKDWKKVAVLSRGYRRKSRGYRLATTTSTANEIGDEPFQIHNKYADVYVAVDKKRTNGVERLLNDDATKDVEVVVLDDAYQHRYINRDLNLLLTDYHRLITEDRLLPSGRLREPVSGKDRADIVIVTKCLNGMKPMDYRIVMKQLELYPYQDLFFTTMVYGSMKQLFGDTKKTLKSITSGTNILLLTGIAEPKPLEEYLKRYTKNITTLCFADHHDFSSHDINTINDTYKRLNNPSIIITTEKDAARLVGVEGLNEEVKEALFVLPMRVKFLLEGKERFDKRIKDSILAKCYRPSK